MGDDDQQEQYNAAAAEQYSSQDENSYSRNNAEFGFDGYEKTTIHPGHWLLLGTTLFCFGIMLIGVPCAVAFKLKYRSKREDQKEFDTAQEGLMGAKEPVDTGMYNIIFSSHKETRKILRLAIPYTFSAVASTTFSNVCLVFVSKAIGTRAVAAYALVQILVGLFDGVLQGPISACTTLCAHAVGGGVGNAFLAGQYIQLAVLLYLLFNIPAVYFWWVYMYDVILYLEWGDEITASLAQDFVRVYIWSYLLGGISSALWQLLEVTNHAVEGTILSTAWGATNVFVIGTLVAAVPNITLPQVGLVYLGTAIFYVALTLGIAKKQKWLKPFQKGLFRSLSFKNTSAMKDVLKQAIPLSLGSFLRNAEWAVLTVFASHLGPAEVAAWAILGSIWEIFYSVTSGIGDASEIRVAYHLGDNHPSMAKLSACKSLLLGMILACSVSAVYFSLEAHIPVWFTSDETLQEMLAELVPFVGVANLTMTFGMQCWSIIGAQGKYKLATWISLFSSWGICMPLSALYVFIFGLDLQGLVSGVVIGYVSTGACLSYVLLTTNWNKVARKIQAQNSDTASGRDQGSDDAEEQMYAALRVDSKAAKASARRNLRLLSLQPGQRSGILLGNVFARPGTYVLMVRNWSPLQGKVKPGDSVIAIDGVDVSGKGALEISQQLKSSRKFERDITVVAPPGDAEEISGSYTDEFVFQAIAEDESTVAPSVGSFGSQSRSSSIKLSSMYV